MVMQCFILSFVLAVAGCVVADVGKNGHAVERNVKHLLGTPHPMNQTNAACKGSGRVIAPSDWNDGYCDCPGGMLVAGDAKEWPHGFHLTDEPGTGACSEGTFWCRNVGHVGKGIVAGWVNDGLCDCCDGSDEWLGRTTCPDTCHQDAAESRAEAARIAAIRASGRRAAEKVLVQARVYREGLEQDLREAEKEVEVLAVSLEEAKEKLQELEKEAARQAPVENTQTHEGDQHDDHHDDLIDDDDFSDDEQEPDVPSEETSIENPELKDAKATHASLSTRHTAAQDTVRSLTRRLHDTDYGPGGIWAGLVGTCIKWDGDPQYTFELCLLDKIMQRPKDGSMAITLGKWGKWMDGGYDTMLYENGQKCWNGPVRQVKVTLQCAMDNRIISVQEPEMCSYAMVLASPAACISRDDVDDQASTEARKETAGWGGYAADEHVEL